MKYDDGFVAYINGVQVAEANAPETLQWDSAASAHSRRCGVDRVSGVRRERGDPRRCTSAKTCWRSTHSMCPTGSDMLIVPELVAQPMAIVAPEKLGFFATPTPGYGNGDNVLGYAAEPAFSVPHGFYSTTQSVAITTPTPGAIIVYTTNGSTPQVDANLNVTNGTLYAGPALDFERRRRCAPGRSSRASSRRSSRPAPICSSMT